MICEDEHLTEINHGLRLIQKKDGLTFGTDAYLLSAFVKKSPRTRAADLGSGTGILPLLLLQNEKIASCDAIEIQPDFVSLIERNAAINRFSEKLHAVEADVRSLPESLTPGSYGLVISNPPYMKTSGKPNESERRGIARHELFGSIDDFVSAAARLLKHGGTFDAVYRPDRLIDLLDALRRHRLEPKKMTFVHARRTSEPSLVLIEAKKGGAAGLTVTRPLILYKSGTTYTEDLTLIYERGNFDEFAKRS